MASHRRAPPLPQQLEPTIEQRCRSLQAVHADPSGRQLQGQCNAVDLPADVGDHLCIAITQRPSQSARKGPFDEQGGSRIAQHVLGRENDAVRRDAQGWKRIDVFAVGTQWFSAGCQDADVRRLLHDCLGQGSDRVDQVLAAVENEQHIALPQVRNDMRGRITATDNQA